MGFLDMRGLVSFGNKTDIDRILKDAAIFTREAQRKNFLLLRLSDRLQDIGRTAARGKYYKNIPLLAKSLDLTGEDLVEAKIIPDRRKRCNIRCERDRRQADAVFFEPAYEFGGNVLAIRSRAAVPAKEQLMSGLQRPDDFMRHFVQYFILGRHKSFLERFLMTQNDLFKCVFHRSTEKDFGQLIHTRRHGFEFSNRFL